MVAAISVAATAVSALSSADSILGTTDTSSTQSGTRHWSFYVVCVGTAAGLVTSIATFILGNFVATGVAAALTLFSGFSAYQIRNFGFFKTLEGYVEKLAERVNALKNLVTGLREDREKLDASARALEKASSTYKEQVRIQIEALQKQISEASGLARELDVHNEGLESTSAASAASITELQSENQRLHHSIESLGKERSALVELVATLSQTNSKLESVAALAKAAGLKFDKENDELRAHNEEAARLVASLETLAQDHTVADHIDASASKLGGTTKGLKAAADELSASTDKAETVLGRLERLLASPRMSALAEAAKLVKAEQTNGQATDAVTVPSTH